MATRAQTDDDPVNDAEVQRSHDEWVRAKVRKGLDQSRDRASLTPIEQAWRELLP